MKRFIFVALAVVIIGSFGCTSGPGTPVSKEQAQNIVDVMTVVKKSGTNACFAVGTIIVKGYTYPVLIYVPCESVGLK